MPENNKQKRDERGFWIKYGEYSQVAVALPATTAVGYAIGYGLDRWLGTSWLYIVFLLIGIAAGLLHVIRFANRVQD